MQTDPTGYADGLNWYNYVGGDPVNFSDPTGLQRFCWTQAGYTTFYQDSDGNGHIEHVQSMQYCTDYESPGSVYPDRP
ncbi:RHS repeat-associated core domain-containing protein, partial [Escherichia coli]|uniref:RHS repeat-associated core domain-containing protein n=6 Tax=Pseudomonadota TaxID=1224 RepID=UPI00359FBF29